MGKRKAEYVAYKNVTMRQDVLLKLDHVVTHMQMKQEREPTWRDDYYLAAQSNPPARSITRQLAIAQLIDAYMKEHDL